MQNSVASRGGVKSVWKAFELLSLLAFDDPSEDGLRLSDLAERVGIPCNTAHNLLKTMVGSGFVAQTRSQAYVVGPRCREIGRSNRLKSLPVNSVIVPALREVSYRTGEAAVFAALAAGMRYCLAAVDGRQAIKVDHEVVAASSLYELPTGRVLVAWAEGDERDAVVARNGFPLDRWDGISDRDGLEEACTALRHRGHCLLKSERFALVSIAYPVLRRDGALLGAVGSYAPLFRCSSAARKEMSAALNACAARLSKNMEQEDSTKG